jgi:hypothetical protein
LPNEELLLLLFICDRCCPELPDKPTPFVPLVLAPLEKKLRAPKRLDVPLVLLLLVALRAGEALDDDDDDDEDEDEDARIEGGIRPNAD